MTTLGSQAQAVLCNKNVMDGRPVLPASRRRIPMNDGDS
jgi:hypothetical protein